MSQTQVLFQLEVTSIDSLYGLTLELYEDGMDDDEEVPCFFLVFKGTPNQDVDSVAQAFSKCHQSSMTEVGLQGMMTPEEFEEKFDESIDMAGVLMADHGFMAQELDKVDPDVLQALMSDAANADPKQLN